MKYLLSGLSVIFLSLLLFVSAPRQITAQSLAKEYANSIVLLLGDDGGGGTGFLVRTPSGKVLLLTNKHVCESVKYIQQEGRRIPTQIVEASESTDLCLMTVPSEFARPLPLALVAPAKYSTVYVIGYGMLLPLAVTQGNFLGDLNQPVFVVKAPDYLTAPVLPGNSGSPVLDEQGNVVGVVFASSMMIDGRAISVPLSDIKTFIAPY